MMLMSDLPIELWMKIYYMKIRLENEDDCKLGTRWRIRTSDQVLRYPKKPRYDRTSARLYNVDPTIQGTLSFLSSLNSTVDPYSMLPF